MTSLAVAFACLIQVPFLMPNIEPETGWNSPQGLPKGATPFSVATFSTLTRTQNITDILTFIKSENPDLLCLQEVSKTDQASLLAKLNGNYPYTATSNNNQVTLSRYKLERGDYSGHSQTNLLLHPEWGQINIINVHMPRPYLRDTLFASWKQLFKQLEAYPKTILCGDLNITPNNTLYDVLRYDYHLNDALTAGYGFTFPNAQRRSSLFGPLIRIDYILSRGLSAKNTRTINASELSDHRAVLTELTLNK